MRNTHVQEALSEPSSRVAAKAELLPGQELPPGHSSSQSHGTVLGLQAQLLCCCSPSSCLRCCLSLHPRLAADTRTARFHSPLPKKGETSATVQHKRPGIKGSSRTSQETSVKQTAPTSEPSHSPPSACDAQQRKGKE